MLNACDCLGEEGRCVGMSVDELMDALALDVLRPLDTLGGPEIDAVKYEVSVHRIVASLREGAAALVRTSSSPLVTDCGEYMLAVYDGAGHAAYVTSGVLPHLTGTEAGIKYIRHCYARDREGIRPGDQFVLNDPYLLGIHTPDMLVARPIFVEDEIVAWVGSLTHTIEIGSKDPGGTADSTDIFQEGIRIPCLKVVSENEPVPHVYRLIERAVRHPALVSLDISAKVAGNNVAGARIEEIAAREGSAFLRGVLAKLIRETETKAREKIAQIPDGRWRHVVYADHNGLSPELIQLAVAVEKVGEVINFDFTGTSGQCPGPVNATLSGTIGTIFTVLVSTLFCDLPPNRGMVSVCGVSVEKGSMFNPRYPAPCYGAPPGPLTLLSSAVTKLVSEMAMAAGLCESITAPWNGSCNSVFMGGSDQFGQLQGTVTLDTNGSGTGGTPWADGDDTAAFMLAPGAMMADIEIYESNYPVLYLYRRQRKDSGGAGQYRGGLGGEIAVVIHGSADWRVGFRGLGTLVSTTHGLAGGFPADCSRVGYLRGIDLESRSAKEVRQLQGDFDAMAVVCEVEPAAAMSPPKLIPEGDGYYLGWSGGGGFGDPLLRTPEFVARDVRAGVLSLERCRDTYGVVLDAAKKVVAEVATTRLREELRAQRLEEATPSPKRFRGERVGEMGRPFYGSLCRGKDGGGAEVLACSSCATVIGAGEEDFWEYLATRDVAPGALGHSFGAEWVSYREYMCPGCGSLVDVRVVETGSGQSSWR